MTQALTALVRPPSPTLDRCVLTCLERGPIDVELAARQHGAYCARLRGWGVELVALEPDPRLPDGVFVEDTAVVLDEVALLASMGHSARRPEVAQVARVLQRYRDCVRVEPPATLEGGDVLRVGRELLVGLSPRTNRAGAEALARVAGRLGYRVTPVEVRGCLHLKTACTALDDETLLLNPAWIDPLLLGGPWRRMRTLEVAPGEPFAANALRVGSRLLLQAGLPRTVERVLRAGHAASTLEISELAKAEAGLTCLGLLVKEAAAT